jgi:NitT/TauT family transport system substrate-binding protein
MSRLFSVGLGLLVVLTFVGCGKKPAASNALPKINFTHDWVPEPEHGGYYAAQLNGYWKEAGVEVNVMPGGPNAEIERIVALDPNGLGISRGDAVILAIQRGLPIVAVNSYFQHDPQGIMVHENSPVKTLSDLEDKDVAIGSGQTFFLYLQKKYNLTKTRIHNVSGGVANFVVDPNYIQQAYPTSEPYYAAKQGVKSRVLLLSDAGFNPYRVVIANKQLVEKHPELVKAFSLGAYRGWKEYYRNPTPTLKSILAISPMMEWEGMKFGFNKMRELHFTDGLAANGESMGAVDPKRWEDLHKLMLDYKLIDKPIDLASAYSTEFTPAKLGIDPVLPATEIPIP